MAAVLRNLLGRLAIFAWVGAYSRDTGRHHRFRVSARPFRYRIFDSAEPAGPRPSVVSSRPPAEQNDPCSVDRRPGARRALAAARRHEQLSPGRLWVLPTGQHRPHVLSW